VHDGASINDKNPISKRHDFVEVLRYQEDRLPGTTRIVEQAPNSFDGSNI
jgi:hypothetical protein